MVSYNLCCHTDCCEAPTKQCRKISAGMIVRFLYLCYAVLTIVVRTVALDEQKDFSDPMNVVKIVLLAAGIPLMIAEALYISIKRRGKELKWFTPNVLFFGLAAFPSIVNLQWNLEKNRDCVGGEPNATVSEATFAFQTDEWTVLLIQIAVVLLVMGKWIAPKGGLSSSEHAELLFVVLCNGADIVEFFGTELNGAQKDNECIMRHFVMAVAAWSSIQFCFVPTAVKRLPMEEMETTVARNEVTLSENGVPNTFQEVPKYKSRFAACLSRMFCFYNAIWGVILQIIFVDGPFFIMRLILMFGRFIRVNNNTVFFAFKNGFSIILGIYRIWSITKHEYSNWKTQMKVTDLTNGI